MITPTDLKGYRSSNPDSDGGTISDQEIIDGEKNNLFADIETESAGTVYRKTFRKNTNPTLAWKNVRTWIASQPQNAHLSLGLSINDTGADNGEEGNMSPLKKNSVIAVISSGDDDRKITLIGEDVYGDHQTEVLTLNGNAEVAGSKVFSKLYGAYVYEISKSHSVTVRQGSNGESLGSIMPNTGSSFLWTDTEMSHGDIEPGASIGLWYRLTWPDGAGAVNANSVLVNFECDKEQGADQ